MTSNSPPRSSPIEPSHPGIVLARLDFLRPRRRSSFSPAKARRSSRHGKSRPRKGPSKSLPLFQATGTPSFFLHSCQALHAKSRHARPRATHKSPYTTGVGETQEGPESRLMPSNPRNSICVPLMPILKSPLRALSPKHKRSRFLDVSVKEEACSLNLAPPPLQHHRIHGRRPNALGRFFLLSSPRSARLPSRRFRRPFHPAGRLGQKLLRVETPHSLRAMPLPRRAPPKHQCRHISRNVRQNLA